MNKLVLVVACFLFTIGCKEKKELVIDPPNFVWLMSEDNSKHYLKLFDEHGIATPNIEKLAENGLIYSRAFSNAPVCSVARTTLATSCYGPRIGTQFHRKSSVVPMPDSLQMFPAYLREAGYYTVNNSKTDYNAESGNEVWDESSKKAHWRNRKEGQPFFSQITYTDSHESRLHFDRELMDTYKPTIDPDSVFVNPNHPDTETFRFTNAYYRDKMLKNDEFVAGVMKELEEDGLLENTFVFYFGDHGGVLPGSKGYLYETGLHIPLVVRIPEKYRDLVGIDVGSTVGNFVSFIDFGPTLLALAGLQVPEGMDGKPFLGKNVDQEALKKKDVTFGYADRFDEKYDLVRSVRKGKYKYLRNYQPFNPDGLYNVYRYKSLAYQEWHDLYHKGTLNEVQKHFFEPREAEQLFDVEADPYETKNLANDPAYYDKVVALRELLTEWVKGMPDLSFYPESELGKGAFQNPVAFGQKNKTEIAELIDISDLSLLTFDEASPAIKEALTSDNPMKKYWALIVYSSFGQEAGLFYQDAKMLTKDENLLVRTRAAEFLALTGQEDPKQVIVETLAASNNGMESLLMLNTVVLLMDGEYQYRFDIDEKQLSEKVLENEWVKRRMEYILARQGGLL
ncbi:sulfatase [Reichenbachiella sp. MALMAid0571]|uniref:sulfatase family protein n=1 Tax=Reichenbachiella sp. MALMAid0571 TaxID=3143939 RepID=UPI0032DF8A03